MQRTGTAVCGRWMLVGSALAAALFLPWNGSWDTAGQAAAQRLTARREAQPLPAPGDVPAPEEMYLEETDTYDPEYGNLGPVPGVDAADSATHWGYNGGVCDGAACDGAACDLACDGPCEAGWCDGGCRSGNGWCDGFHGGGCGGCRGTIYGAYESVIVQPHFSRATAIHLVEREMNSTPGNYDNTFTELSFDWDYEYTPRFELGYLGCRGLGGRLRYWQFDHDARRRGFVFGPPGAPNGGNGWQNEGEANTFALHSMELHVFDAEALVARCHWLMSAGMRYVRMDQEYDIFSDFSDGFFTHHDFEGAGPTVALEYNTSPGQCLGFFVKCRGSLLYGDSGQVIVNFDNLDVFLRDIENDLIGIAEIQLGLIARFGGECGRGGYFVSAAVEAQYWSNIGSTLRVPLGVEDPAAILADSAQDADMGLIGFTIGIGATR